MKQLCFSSYIRRRGTVDNRQSHTENSPTYTGVVFPDRPRAWQAIQRDAPERANTKPPVPTRRLPRSVHSIRDGSPVADQMAAAATGARALATVIGTVSAPLMAP